MPPLIVDSKREHALEPLDAGRPVLLVGMDDDFGIGGGSETMTAALKMRLDRPVIVNFAVEHDPAGAVLVRHRLRPVGAIDDRQATVAERRMRVGENAVA